MVTGVTRTTARAIERGLIVTRERVTKVLDGVQLRLRAIDVSRDPETQRWTKAMKARVERGEIDDMLAEEPDDPRAFVDGLRRSSPS